MKGGGDRRWRAEAAASVGGGPALQLRCKQALAVGGAGREQMVEGGGNRWWRAQPIDDLWGGGGARPAAPMQAGPGQARGKGGRKGGAEWGKRGRQHHGGARGKAPGLQPRCR